MDVIHWTNRHEIQDNIQETNYGFCSQLKNYNQVSCRWLNRNVTWSMSSTNIKWIYWMVLYLISSYRQPIDSICHFVHHRCCCTIYRIGRFHYDSFYKDRIQGTLAACADNKWRRRLIHRLSSDNNRTNGEEETDHRSASSIIIDEITVEKFYRRRMIFFRWIYRSFAVEPLNTRVDFPRLLDTLSIYFSVRIEIVQLFFICHHAIIDFEIKVICMMQLNEKRILFDVVFTDRRRS